MKLYSKILFLIGLTAFLASCQKELLPEPAPSPVQEVRQRASDTTGTDEVGIPASDNNFRSGDDEVVGGGDDDRDGGEKKGKPKGQ